ncbi:MAG TPA: nuclear transport factor 2 family protein [Candidatus Sulfotelmatobacter sp.]|nr:nuclear transport factor 2 family protein [Candidatus Sulfotelmatobacter sp.]
MALTKETVAAWLRAYVRAWETYDPEAVAELFSGDATYSYFPFDEPIRGRVAIVASWLEGKDPPGTYEASYEPVAIDGSLAVAQGRSRYFKDPSRRELVREYDNIFLIEFDDNGRCHAFREWYMRPRGQKEPA